MSQTPEQLFLAGWKIAGPVLEDYRTNKLRDMGSDHGARLLRAASSNQEVFYSHGLARWQVWMMRLQVKHSIEAERG